LLETDALLEKLETNRNKYINEAIEFYNQYQKRKPIEERLIEESKLINKDSKSVLNEFEILEGEILK